MIPSLMILAGVVVAALGTLFFSTLTYALRDFSRPRLAEYLDQRQRGQWLEPTMKHSADLIYVTAVGRLLANILIIVGSLNFFQAMLGQHTTAQYLAGAALSAVILLFASVAIPSAAAKYAGESIIGSCAPVLHTMRVVLWPITKLMQWVDDVVRRVTGAGRESETEQIEEEILSAVEEGEKEGVVDTAEREMIESVIQFRDTTVSQIMTGRTEVVALELGAKLDEIKALIEESGHSRVPVYEGTLDHIVGILYARDLLKHLGLPPDKFDMRSAMRQAIFVPETKPLRDLLNDFRLQKVHMAIVLDEYGGTTGLVTIEDILEELVGEITDEHEPREPAMFNRLSDQAADVDARIRVDELNRLMGLNLPEDAGYETLAGFILTTLGRIPARGEKLEHAGAKYTIVDAVPQRIDRVRIELALQSAETNTPTGL